MKSKLSFLILLLVSILSINAYAQTASRYNKPPESPTKKEIPKGPSLYGVFEGRPPCNAIEKQLGLPVRPECTKVKWRLTFFQDPVTHQPTTYALEGALLPSTGKWIMSSGELITGDAFTKMQPTITRSEYGWEFKGAKQAGKEVLICAFSFKNDDDKDLMKDLFEGIEYVGAWKIYSV